MMIKRMELIGINQIISKLKEQVFDINTQYKFLKIEKKLKEELEILKEQQLLLIKQYGEPQNLNTGEYKIKDDCIKDCEKAINEINNSKIQVPDIYFSLEELEGLNLTYEELSCLDPFIKI